MRRFHNHLRRAAASAIALLIGAAWCPAQETFHYVGQAGQQVWEVAENWTGGSGAFSQWPGQAPDAGTRDSADLTGDFGGDVNLRIGAPGVRLDTLTLGSTGLAETVVSGDLGATLSVDEIHPRGGLFATNRLTIDLLLDQNLDVRNALSTLSIDGRLINNQPSARRDIVNGSERTLTLNGSTVLSDAAGMPGSLRFRNEGVADTALFGPITDGAAPGGQINGLASIRFISRLTIAFSTARGTRQRA